VKFASLPLRTRRLLVGAAGAGALVLGFVAYNRIFVAPQAALRASIDLTTSSIFALQSELDNEVEHRRRLRDFARTTLGGEVDLVQHRLRTGLMRAAEESGLSGVVVDAGDPQEILNPAVSAKGVSVPTKRALRTKPDFEMIRGSVQGTGTLDQATRTLALLQSQAWIHRIDAFSLRPVGKMRDRYEFRAEVATLFARDLVDRDAAEPELSPPAVDLESLARIIAARAVFSPLDPRTPAVVAAVSPEGVPAAPTTPAIVFPPYEDWHLTGLMVGRAGTSAILQNRKSGQSLTLEKGGTILNAIFVDSGNDSAIFEIEGKRYQVFNGSSLASRQPEG